MNIPDEGFFTLLTQGMRNRTVETLQRALYHTLRDAILQGNPDGPLPFTRIAGDGRTATPVAEYGQCRTGTAGAGGVPDTEPSGNAGGTTRLLPPGGGSDAARRAA